MQPAYVGVTGFSKRADVDAAIAKFDALQGVRAKRLLEIGVLANKQTLTGQVQKTPSRYPKFSEIADLFPPHRRTVNLIHYTTDDRDHLLDQLKTLAPHGGINLDGFQINVPWPDPKRIITGYSRMVLQLNSRALEMEGNTPSRVADRLTAYQGVITDILIEASDGSGTPLDLQKLEAYLRAIITKHPWLGLGIAGGLPGVSLDRLKDFVRVFSFVSIDADERLRSANDQLESRLVNDYLAQADRLMLQARKVP